jgi:hypothetical protein
VATRYDRITPTIEREWLAQIIAGTKKIEYRQIKPCWTKRFEMVSVPFELRLLNGMNPPVPEVMVLIHRITKDRRAGEYRLHIKKALGHCDSLGPQRSARSGRFGHDWQFNGISWDEAICGTEEKTG